MFLLKVREWVKSHWKTILFTAIAVVGLVIAIYVAFSNYESSMGKLIEDLNTKHRKEIEELVVSHDESIKARDEAIKKYEDQLKQIQANYDQAKLDLDSKKTQIIVKIIKETNSDPGELARRLAKTTGFVITDAKE